MNQDLANLFLSKTFTKNQALRRLRLIKELLELLFFQGSNPDDFENTFSKLKAKYSPNFVGQEGLEIDVNFIKELGPDFFKNFSSVNINDQLASLEKAVNDTKTILIYLPFELPGDHIIDIGGWLKKNLGVNTLFEINYDPELIGGLAISYKGIFKDYSLRAKVNENKAKVLEVLGGYKK